MTNPPSSPTPPSSGPSPAPPSAPKQQRKRGTWPIAIAALTVSLVSLVVALMSLLSAGAARDAADDAERLAEALAPADPGAAPPTTDSQINSPTTNPPLTGNPQETGAPPRSFDPQATFNVHYSDEVLNPQVASSEDAYIDLDEPAVVFDSSQADIVLADGFSSNPPQIDLQRSSVRAAPGGGPDATPAECLDRLRTSPLNNSQEIAAQRGTVLCLLTSLDRAAEQGITQKVVVLHVTALGDEGRVTIELDAWDQPR